MSLFESLNIRVSKSSKDFLVNRFGGINSVGTSFQDIWFVGGDYTFLTSDSTIEAVSNNANDDAAGLGARIIHIQGLDSNFMAITENISLVGNGTSIATTSSFIRVNSAHVETCGTYGGSNYNNIEIRVSGGGTALALIGGAGLIDTANYGYCESKLGIYTVPSGFTAYINSLKVSSDGNKGTHIILYKRESADDLVTMTPRRLVWEDTENIGSKTVKFDTFIEIPEKTDIFFRAKTISGTTGVDVNWDMILLKKRS